MAVVPCCAAQRRRYPPCCPVAQQPFSQAVSQAFAPATVTLASGIPQLSVAKLVFTTQATSSAITVTFNGEFTLDDLPSSMIFGLSVASASSPLSPLLVNAVVFQPLLQALNPLVLTLDGTLPADTYLVTVQMLLRASGSVQCALSGTMSAAIFRVTPA